MSQMLNKRPDPLNWSSHRVPQQPGFWTGRPELTHEVPVTVLSQHQGSAQCICLQTPECTHFDGLDYNTLHPFFSFQSNSTCVTLKPGQVFIVKVGPVSKVLGESSVRRVLKLSEVFISTHTFVPRGRAGLAHHRTCLANQFRTILTFFFFFFQSHFLPAQTLPISDSSQGKSFAVKQGRIQRASFALHSSNWQHKSQGTLGRDDGNRSELLRPLCIQPGIMTPNLF